MAFRRMVFLIWERLLVVLMFLLKFVFQIESTLQYGWMCEIEVKA